MTDMDVTWVTSIHESCWSYRHPPRDRGSGDWNWRYAPHTDLATRAGHRHHTRSPGWNFRSPHPLVATLKTVRLEPFPTAGMTMAAPIVVGDGPAGTRLVVETDDGSLVYVTAHGRMDLVPGAPGCPALLATTLEASTTWLNRVLAVARASGHPTQLQRYGRRHRLTKPVIAAANGDAYGGGIELASVATSSSPTSERTSR